MKLRMKGARTNVLDDFGPRTQWMIRTVRKVLPLWLRKIIFLPMLAVMIFIPKVLRNTKWAYEDTRDEMKDIVRTRS